MKKTAAAVALMAALAAGITACGPGVAPRPEPRGSVSATCKLFWTYQSAHGIPRYPSFAAAYQADMAEHGHPSTPGYVYDIMPVLEPTVRITARSSVNIASIEVVFYDNSGNKTGHSYQLAVNKILTSGHSYAPDTAAEVWGLSDPETGDTNVVSCAAAATPIDAASGGYRSIRVRAVASGAT